MHAVLAALPELLASGPDASPRLAAGGPDLTRYLLVCAALVVAIGILGFGLQRVVGGAWRVRAARRSMRVVDVLPLGRRQRVAVVTCYDRTFVLGVGDHEVSLVAELDTEEVRAAETLKEPTAGATARRVGRRDFEKLLRALPRRRTAVAPAKAGKRGARLGRGEGVVG